MIIVAMIESLITLGASLVLFGKLRRINDVFEVSLEIQKVGACALLTTGECSFAASTEICFAPTVSDPCRSAFSVLIQTEWVAAVLYRIRTVVSLSRDRYAIHKGE